MIEKFLEIMRMPKGPLRSQTGSALVRECRIAGHSFAQIRLWISKANDILMDVDAWMHEYKRHVFANILTDHPDRDKYIALTDIVNELFLSNASSACISKEVRKFEFLFKDVVSEKPRSLMILREGGASLLHLNGEMKATDERIEALVVRALGGTGRVRFKIHF